jgi:acyl dehydratase
VSHSTRATTLRTAAELQQRIDQEVGVSKYITFSQDAINRFAESTDDMQWIHVDPNRCSVSSPYGATIVHGFFLLSSLTSLLSQVVEVGQVSRVLNIGVKYARFLSPVRVDSQVRARVKVKAVDIAGLYVQVVFEITLECRGNITPCCVAELELRYYTDLGKL